jgi:two-component sensor histidine kinase
MSEAVNFVNEIWSATEAGHRIANSLALLEGLVRTQARAIGKSGKPLTAAEAHLLLDGIAARISIVAQVHHRIAKMPDGAIAFASHLRTVCDGLVAAYSSERQPIHIEYFCQECLVPTKFVQPLTLIVNELILNALKYAHPAGVPLRLAVGCDVSNGALVLTVDDDGVGLPEGFDYTKDGNLGFRVIRSLCDELQAEFDIQSSSLGMSFEIVARGIPIANAQTA